MKLTLTQAAEKLNISSHSISTLIHKGVLTDLKPNNPNQKRHFSLLDSNEVNSFKKIISKFKFNKITDSVALELKKLFTESKNGNYPIQINSQVIKKDKTSQKLESTPINGITTRLNRLEQKLDQLIKIWS